MFESDARRQFAPVVQPVATTFEDDEPPSHPRRHPLWADVPDEQWDDWRWQTHNAIRSVRQLRNLLGFTPTNWKRSAAWRASTNSPSRRTTSPSSTRPTRPTRSGFNPFHRRWRRRTRPATSSTTRSKRTRTHPSPGSPTGIPTARC